MTPEKALELIEEMAKESQRTVKEGILTELLSHDLGKFIVRWTYDPFVTFGIKPVRHASNLTQKVPFKMEDVADLLMKLSQRELTGNAAADVVSTCLKVADDTANDLLWRILNKDLRCGIAESTIQKVSPGLIPTFAVMRAHPYEEKRVKKFPVAVEPKLDGYRFTFLCRNGNGGFFTRSGKRSSAAEHLVEPMIKTAIKAAQIGNEALEEILLGGRAGSRQNLNFMVDGEMIVDDSFAETGALRRTSETAKGAKFHVFDIMSFENFDAMGPVKTPYINRRRSVIDFVDCADSTIITKTPAKIAHSHEEIIEAYNEFRALGLEGAMVKTLEGDYDKKKSYGWMKIKAEDTEDLPIVGFYNGEKNKEFENSTGGIIVQRYNKDNDRVYVRIGGGLSKELREELRELWMEDASFLGIDSDVGFKPGWSEALEKIERLDHDFKLLGRLVEVEFHEETPDGSLRHPRFIRFRDDKAGEIDKS